MPNPPLTDNDRAKWVKINVRLRTWCESEMEAEDITQREFIRRNRPEIDNYIEELLREHGKGAPPKDTQPRLQLTQYYRTHSA